MTTGPGSLIGEGRTAEVFEYGDGRVLKLLRPGFSEAALRTEALKTAGVGAAGVPAPAVHGFEEVDGRLGVVFDRAPGTLMLDKILSAPHKVRWWGALLAKVHVRLMEHQLDQLPDIREVLAEKIQLAEALTKGQRRQSLDALATLPEGTAVLHGDFHPLNVYLSESGPTVIDWLDSSRGPIEADIVRSLWLTSRHVIPPDSPNRWAITPAAVLLGRSYRLTVLRLTSLAEADIQPWRLPVIAGRLSEGIQHEEKSLLAEVRRQITLL